VSLSPAELARYSRHLLLPEFGTAGQEKLAAARVLVVGAGGLGSPAALYLAAAGVGTLGLIDCDRVDVSNLQRQVLFDTAQIGQPKAITGSARLAALNPAIRVIAHDLELRAHNVMQILADYDVVLDGSDRVATRYLVNDACVLLGRTLVSAAIHRFEGQATTCVPNAGPCYRCLFPEPAVGAAPSCAEAGVLGVLPGVLGAIQATEAIKVITGIGAPLIGRLLTYDALAMRFDEFRFARDTDCRVCGAYRDIHAPHDIEESCAPAHAPGAAIAPAELRLLLAAGAASRPLVLIDVREPFEFLAGHFEGARNIPLGQLEQRLGELSPRDRTVFVCRVGERSAKALAMAQTAGHDAAAHLQGGMLAWVREVGTDLIIA
jgi:molybdopterin/thiamine biosynthesis adenylyltransferase/rhodanese-related sulfurtransferase